MAKQEIRAAIESFPNDQWFTWDEVAAKLGQTSAIGLGILAEAQKIENETADKSRIFFLSSSLKKGQWTTDEGE
jgi:hypothetical protein